MFFFPLSLRHCRRIMKLRHTHKWRSGFRPRFFYTALRLNGPLPDAVAADRPAVKPEAAAFHGGFVRNLTRCRSSRWPRRSRRRRRVESCRGQDGTGGRRDHPAGRDSGDLTLHFAPFSLPFAGTVSAGEDGAAIADSQTYTCALAQQRGKTLFEGWKYVGHLNMMDDEPPNGLTCVSSALFITSPLFSLPPVQQQSFSKRCSSSWRRTRRSRPAPSSLLTRFSMPRQFQLFRLASFLFSFFSRLKRVEAPRIRQGCAAANGVW